MKNFEQFCKYYGYDTSLVFLLKDAKIMYAVYRCNADMIDNFSNRREHVTNELERVARSEFALYEPERSELDDLLPPTKEDIYSTKDEAYKGKHKFTPEAKGIYEFITEYKPDNGDVITKSDKHILSESEYKDFFDIENSQYSELKHALLNMKKICEDLQVELCDQKIK